MSMPNVYLCEFLTVDNYLVMQLKCDEDDILIVMVKNKMSLISLWKGNK